MPVSTLRSVLGSAPLCLIPGVATPLDARIAEGVGFSAVFVTGAGVANTLFGYPDIGLLGLGEVTDAVRRITSAVDVPVLVDADTGYGNHLNVYRTIKSLEAAGAAGAILEDQVEPKRCGHLDGKRVISVIDMTEKLIAAQLARTNDDFVIVARTDAIATDGIESAIERGRHYAEAGADVLFVEAPRTREDLAAIPHMLDAHCLANMVDGGVTPIVTAHDLEAMGYSGVLYANVALRAGARAVRDALGTLSRDGDSLAIADTILSWPDRQALVGLPDWLALDDRVRRRANA